MPRPIFPESGIPGGQTLVPYTEKTPRKQIDQPETPTTPQRFTNLTPAEITEYFLSAQERINTAWLRVDPEQLPSGITINANTNSSRWQIHFRPDTYISASQTLHHRTMTTDGFTIDVQNKPQLSWWNKAGSRHRTHDYKNSPSSLEMIDLYLGALLSPAEQQKPEEAHTPTPAHRLEYPTIIDQFWGTFLRPFPNLTGLGISLPAENLGTWYVTANKDHLIGKREQSGLGVLEEFSVLSPQTGSEHIVYQSKPDGKPKGRRQSYWNEEARDKALAAAQSIVNLGIRIQKPTVPLVLGL